MTVQEQLLTLLTGATAAGPRVYPLTAPDAVVKPYFAILIGMMFDVLKVKDSQALLLMLGSLTTGWGVVMAFWFGTTNDSGRKTELLAQSAPVR